MSRTAQLHRIRTKAYRSPWDMPRVAPPVDVSDVSEFPNIAEAIAHAKKKGLL